MEERLAKLENCFISLAGLIDASVDNLDSTNEIVEIRGKTTEKIFEIILKQKKAIDILVKEVYKLQGKAKYKSESKELNFYG